MEMALGQHLKGLSGPLLLTGHTGFKGTWMTFLLERLKVPVIGYSLSAENDSLFNRADRSGAIPEKIADIRDYQTLENFIDLHRPSTIVHMAAQPLVLKSYDYPRETFDINVMGTVNVLDIAFKKDYVKAVMVVTTDKVYKNDDSGHAFGESDPLEGKDPYSASKVATESVVAAWQHIAKTSGGPKVLSVRAGNVIGGGDFAVDRIIPDLVRGIIGSSPIYIRNPESTRPWQHVIDPLVGYLMCMEAALTHHEIKKMNFGPSSSSLSVRQLVDIGAKVFPSLEQLITSGESNKIDLESKSLSLNSFLSKELLGWAPHWDSDEAILKTFEWWQGYFAGNSSAQELCLFDIENYFGRTK
jgi:CDP-glucose 4,6-dehydratase